MWFASLSSLPRFVCETCKENIMLIAFYFRSSASLSSNRHGRLSLRRLAPTCLAKSRDTIGTCVSVSLVDAKTRKQRKLDCRRNDSKHVWHPDEGIACKQIR